MNLLISFRKLCCDISQSRLNGPENGELADPTVCARGKRFVFTLLVVFFVLLFAACGSGGTGESTGRSASEFETEPVQILQRDGFLTVDDVVAAGWKKSKQLSAELRPDATGVWYGFFDQRDVEVRIYPSHAVTISAGTDPADDATGRGKPAPFAVGGISATRMSYGAYAVVGNVILQCEVKIEDCQALLDGIQ